MAALDSSNGSNGTDASERGPALITKSHAYLVKELNQAENAEEKSAEFVDRIAR